MMADDNLLSASRSDLNTMKDNIQYRNRWKLLLSQTPTMAPGRPDPRRARCGSSNPYGWCFW
jgi:hypothetical protein